MPFIVAVTPSMVMYFSTISFLFYKSLWLQALMCHHLGRSWRRSGDQVSLFFHIKADDSERGLDCYPAFFVSDLKGTCQMLHCTCPTELHMSIVMDDFFLFAVVLTGIPSNCEKLW
jgi:hypothetical protein